MQNFTVSYVYKAQASDGNWYEIETTEDIDARSMAAANRMCAAMHGHLPGYRWTGCWCNG